jgi:hypothetical protein
MDDAAGLAHLLVLMFRASTRSAMGLDPDLPRLHAVGS